VSLVSRGRTSDELGAAAAALEVRHARAGQRLRHLRVQRRLLRGARATETRERGSAVVGSACCVARRGRHAARAPGDAPPPWCASRRGDGVRRVPPAPRLRARSGAQHTPPLQLRLSSAGAAPHGPGALSHGGWRAREYRSSAAGRRPTRARDATQETVPPALRRYTLAPRSRSDAAARVRRVGAASPRGRGRRRRARLAGGRAARRSAAARRAQRVPPRAGLRRPRSGPGCVRGRAHSLPGSLLSRTRPPSFRSRRCGAAAGAAARARALRRRLRRHRRSASSMRARMRGDARRCGAYRRRSA
jgi:hypothetical protein